MRSDVHLRAAVPSRPGADPRGARAWPPPPLPVVPRTPRPPSQLPAGEAAAARSRGGARGWPLTDATRGAPPRSPPRTRCASPPSASSSRWKLEDGAAAAATPAAEPENAAAAQPTPPGARSRPHLPPLRLLAPRPRTRQRRRGSWGSYTPGARLGAFLAAAGPARCSAAAATLKPPGCPWVPPRRRSRHTSLPGGGAATPRGVMSRDCRQTRVWCG